MRIIKLVLVGYIRLSLRAIERIEYIPKEKTQIILGSNGSGKSSLMKELSPLPAVPSEYRKGGSKEITIEHRGKEYLLISSFTEDGNLFEFYCDGINLNPGRTVTVYKELVKEHFNYTTELHSLITGRVLFHELSVNDRRKLFMSMNKTDFSYAFGYFNKLKEKARDLTGTITQLQKRLSNEIDGMLTPEQETSVKRDAEEMRVILEALLTVKKPSSEDPRVNEQECEALQSHYVAIYQELQSALRQYDTIASREPLEVLEAKYEKDSHLLSESRKELNIRYEQHLKLENELKEVQTADSVDIFQLTNEIDSLTDMKAVAEKDIELDLPWALDTDSKPVFLLDMVNMLADTLQHFADTLVPYKDREDVQSVTRDIYNDTTGQIAQHLDILGRAKGSLSYLKTTLEEMEKSKKDIQVSCPNCNHAWHLGYSEQKYNQTVKDISVVSEQVQHHEKQILKLQELVKDFDLYLTIRRDIAKLYSNHPALSGFWDYLGENKIFSTNPERIGHEVNRLRSYLNARMVIENCSTMLNEKLKLRGFYEAARNKSKGKIEESFRELEATIQTVHGRVKMLTEANKLLMDEIASMKEIQALYVQFTTLTVELNRTKKDVIDSYMDGVLGDFISALKTDIVLKERAVVQASMKKAIIENTEASIQSYKDELKLVNVAIDALSPKTGLIAQGMSLFINTYINEVNAFIASVWSYPLTLDMIKPVEDEDIDLDYKFSVRVNNTSASPDIASTSSGMREIIHLACVITAVRFLGFDYHPVFLDEFAVKMDDAHRKAAYSIIEHLIDDAHVSQVFLISHYENGYSSLSAADITVLCDANVVMPKHLTYNSCATIS